MYVKEVTVENQVGLPSSIGQIQRADVLLRASAEPVLEGDQCGAS